MSDTPQQEWEMNYFSEKCDVETLATKAHLTLHTITSTLYLVIRVERLLIMSDVDKDLTFYLKPKNVRNTPHAS